MKQTEPLIDWRNGTIQFSSQEQSETDSHSLLFLGDLCPAGIVEDVLLNQSSEEVFGQLLDEIASADLTFFNLEAPLTSESTPAIKAGPYLRAGPEVAKELSRAGLDVACLANNHIMDFGLPGLLSTLDALKRESIIAIGAGLSSEEACVHEVVDASASARVGVINSAEAEEAAASPTAGGACDHSLHDILRKPPDRRVKADTLVAILHGGKEYSIFPPPHTYKLYNQAAEYSQLVIGHHPHVPQGISVRNQGLIVYSLGNLLFDASYLSPHPLAEIGFAIRTEHNQEILLSARLIPYKIQNGTHIKVMHGEEKVSFFKTLRKLATLVISPERVRERWDALAVSSARDQTLPLLAVRALSASTKGSVSLWLKNILQITLFSLARFGKHRKDAAILRNKIATETHRELLIRMLDNLSEN
ncbi:MAG: CapA family protein [Candidatus Thorarchaeota archaeon]